MSTPTQPPMSAYPTVARVVHYYTTQKIQQFNGAGLGPYPAIISQVFDVPEHSPAGTKPRVNLTVFPPFGQPFHAGSVQEGEGPDEFNSSWWCWPPRA